MEEQQTKNRKTLKIILIIVLSAAIVLAGAVAVCLFVKKTPNIKTEYGTVKNVLIDSENSFTVRLSAPYNGDDIKYISDASQKCVLKEDGSEQEYDAVVKSIAYSAQKDEEIQKGTVEITFETTGGFSFEDGGEYLFEMPDKTVTEKKTGTSVGEVKVKFTTEKSFGDKFFATRQTIDEYDIKETEISRAMIEKQDDKFFLVVQVKDDELTNLNEKNIEEKTAGVSYAYKGNVINLMTVFNDITISIDKAAGIVEVRCPINKEDVVSGTEYVAYLSQELLVNDSLTLANSEMSATFTYMG